MHPRNLSAYSKPINLEYSVPQGSCIGPVLHLLYASSLEEVITPPEPPATNDPKEKSPTAEKIYRMVGRSKGVELLLIHLVC